MSRGIIALDADGVLLDYGLAYATAWQRAFGSFPKERDPTAYWPIDRWEVDRLAGERLDRLRQAFDDDFWTTIPPVQDAVEACWLLHEAGFELICVTALHEKFRSARERNLRLHGFPIHIVHTTPGCADAGSPKAATLNRIRPLAFVDDYLPYFVGVLPVVHRALIFRGVAGSPNSSDLLIHTDSQHGSLLDFVRWWLARCA